MRCLVRSSWLVVFVLSATSLFGQGTASCLHTLKPRFESVRYRATIDVLDKHLSGILIFKTQEDSSIRSVFLNEMGVTFFDVSFWDDRYLFHSMLPSLNKSAVKVSLAKDLGMMLMRGIFKKVQYGIPVAKASRLATAGEQVIPLKRRGVITYFPQAGCTQAAKIVNSGRKAKVVTITQKYLPEHSMPDSIFVEHHRVHFTIRLKHMHAAE